MKQLVFKWCSLCMTWYIECPKCGNNSCNGGSGNEGTCEVCKDVYDLQDTISLITSDLIEKLIKCDEKV